MQTQEGDQKKYNIEKLDNNPGLYFSRRFSFLLATESWTIAVDYNLQELENKMKEVSSIWNEAQKLQHELKTIGSTWSHHQFQQTRNTLKNTELKVKRLHEIIGAQPTPTSKRRRRGIFNVIGTGLKTLFGTMDNDDAEYLNEKISTIDSNQHRVYQLEKDQLTVVKNTVSDITHTFRDFRDNQETIIKTQNYLEQLQELSSKKIETISEQMDCHFKVLGALQIVDLVCKDLDNFVDSLNVGVDSMRHGSLSTLLLAPDDLMKYLRDITRFLKNGSTLPLVVTEDSIHEYYTLIRVQAWLVNGHILRFFLNVPLKQSERVFTMYEVLPVPTKTQGTVDSCVYSFVQPQVDFLAISSDEQRFIPMSQRQVDNCKGESIKVCLGPNLVNNVVAGQETCELAYYRNVEPPRDTCDVRLAYIPTSIWTEVTDTNQWIFVLPREELLTITCPGRDGLLEHEGTEWVQGTGLLTLPPRCQMFGSSFRIYSRVVSKSRIDYNISSVIRIPQNNTRISNEIIKISNETYEIVAKKLKNITSHIKFVSTSLNDLNSASIRLRTLESFLKQYEPDNYVTYETHYWTISGVCLVVLVVMYLIYCLGIHKRCRKAHQKYLPVMFKVSKPEELDIGEELDSMPLEDRVKLSRKRQSRTKNDAP